MARIRLPFLTLVLVVLAACSTPVVDRAPEAPAVPAAGFVSLGPADAPSRLRDRPDTSAPLLCAGPLVSVSGQPTDADFAAARAAGYRTVVNFRNPGEPGYVDERATVEALGMRYVSIPVAGMDVRAESADLLAPVLADGSAGPVLLHCRSGTRAKMVWTVWLARHAGLPADEAMNYGERAGLAGESAAAVAKVLR